jgi:hypothetical protein
MSLTKVRTMLASGLQARGLSCHTSSVMLVRWPLALNWLVRVTRPLALSSLPVSWPMYSKKAALRTPGPFWDKRPAAFWQK